MHGHKLGGRGGNVMGNKIGGRFADGCLDGRSGTIHGSKLSGR